MDMMELRRTIIASEPHLETATGLIASFYTDVSAPLSECKIQFSPAQGAGTPSPSNVIPVTGCTGFTCYRKGKNLIDVSALTGTDSVWWKGKVVTGYSDHCVTPLIPVKAGVTYTLNRNSDRQDYVCLFDKNKEYITQIVWDKYNTTKVIDDGVCYIGITISTLYLNDPYPQLEVGGTASNYEQYKTAEDITVTFPALGKNLLDITQTSKLNPGATGSTITISDGVISIDAVASSARTYAVFSQEFPAGTYTIKALNTGAVSTPRLLCSTEIDGSTYNTYYTMYAKQLSAANTTTFTLTETSTLGIVLSNVAGESGSPGSLYNIQLESGSSATTYEPYTNTVYGGYLDLSTGNLVAEYEVMTSTWGNWGNVSDQGDGTELRYKKFTNPVSGNSAGSSCSFCNVANYQYANENGTVHFYIVGNSYNCRIYLPSGTDTSLQIQAVGKLITPITVATLTPTQIKAIVGKNNIWSDANGNVTVKYWTH